MTVSRVRFACPRCRGPLRSTPNDYSCARCARQYPVLCGIPDFRLEPDPYIGMEEDRQKGAALYLRGRNATFEDLLHDYYAITPEDPPDLAARWSARATHEVAIARALIGDLAPAPGDPESAGGALLDVGCSTGATLIACRDLYGPLVGIDIAFRWLAIGRIRLRDAGLEAAMVCANAEHLPFPDGAFQAVTCLDVLDHVRDMRTALQEAYRVSSAGARVFCAANNRFAPVPEPNIHLWGVGYLPRCWQAGYVALRRGDLHPYRIRLSSPWELARLMRAAGYRRLHAAAARLDAPHLARPLLQRALRAYNRIRNAPFVRTCLVMAGPRVRLTAVRPAAADAGTATASPAPSPSADGRADT